MRIAILVCATAIVITFIHDVTGPMILLTGQLELAQAIERIQKRLDKPPLEIIPKPQFKANPELRKEKL